MKIKKSTMLKFPYNILFRLEEEEPTIIKNEDGTMAINVNLFLEERLITRIMIKILKLYYQWMLDINFNDWQKRRYYIEKLNNLMSK